MPRKMKIVRTFETINPDRRKAVRRSLEDKIGAKNLKEFLEGGKYRGKREEIGREIADELSLSETVVWRHIKTLKLSEDHEWILEMADGGVPTVVKALTKAPSDRTEPEKDAIEQRTQKNSDEIPNVVEESEKLYREPDGLSFRSTVKLARELDRFAKLPLKEQVTVALEAALRGRRQIRRLLWDAEEREREENKSKESIVQQMGNGEYENVTIQLDLMDVDAAENMMEKEDISSIKTVVHVVFSRYMKQEGYFEP